MIELPSSVIPVHTHTYTFPLFLYPALFSLSLLRGQEVSNLAGVVGTSGNGKGQNGEGAGSREQSVFSLRRSR